MGPSWDQELFRTPGPDLPVAPARRFQGFWGPVWGPKLVQFLLFLGSGFGPLFEALFDKFWGNVGVPSGVKTESKSGPFFGKAPGGHLEALWEASRLSWGSLGRPGVPDLL